VARSLGLGAFNEFEIRQRLGAGNE
jgi:hypothetical protein